MYKVVEEFVETYEELHRRFPDMDAVVYDIRKGNNLFNGGIVYGVANNDADCKRLFEESLRKHKGCSHNVFHTSPVDLNGRPYFIDGEVYMR